MESYGFQCHQIRMPNKSIEAYILGCNMALSEGRNQFVQLLYDDGGWNVELQKTSTPEPDEFRAAEEDSDLALSTYMREEMKGYAMLSGGTGSSEYFDGTLALETGMRRQGEQIVVRAVLALHFSLRSVRLLFLLTHPV